MTNTLKYLIHDFPREYPAIFTLILVSIIGLLIFAFIAIAFIVLYFIGKLKNPKEIVDEPPIEQEEIINEPPSIKQEEIVEETTNEPLSIEQEKSTNEPPLSIEQEKSTNEPLVRAPIPATSTYISTTGKETKYTPPDTIIDELFRKDGISVFQYDIGVYIKIPYMRNTSQIVIKDAILVFNRSKSNTEDFSVQEFNDYAMNYMIEIAKPIKFIE